MQNWPPVLLPHAPMPDGFEVRGEYAPAKALYRRCNKRSKPCGHANPRTCAGSLSWATRMTISVRWRSNRANWCRPLTLTLRSAHQGGIGRPRSKELRRTGGFTDCRCDIGAYACTVRGEARSVHYARDAVSLSKRWSPLTPRRPIGARTLPPTVDCSAACCVRAVSSMRPPDWIAMRCVYWTSSWQQTEPTRGGTGAGGGPCRVGSPAIARHDYAAADHQLGSALASIRLAVRQHQVTST